MLAVSSFVINCLGEVNLLVLLVAKFYVMQPTVLEQEELDLIYHAGRKQPEVSPGQVMRDGSTASKSGHSSDVSHAPLLKKTTKKKLLIYRKAFPKYHFTLAVNTGRESGV